MKFKDFSEAYNFLSSRLTGDDLKAIKFIRREYLSTIGDYNGLWWTIRKALDGERIVAKGKI